MTTFSQTRCKLTGKLITTVVNMLLRSFYIFIDNFTFHLMLQNTLLKSFTNFSEFNFNWYNLFDNLW